MAKYSNDALGSTVRALRTAAGLSQQALGVKAGYAGGAGVAISRLESGQLHPSEEKFEGLCEALGVTVDEMRRLAIELTDEEGEEAGAPTTPKRKELNARAEAIQSEVDERTTSIQSLGNAFNAEHDRARDEFFEVFYEAAQRIAGAPQPDELDDDGGEEDDGVVTASRLFPKTNDAARVISAGAGAATAGLAVGGAAAYGTFVAVAAYGTASTGAAIAGLSGIAATNATLAALGGGTLAAGGAGVAGGVAVLTSIVAAPVLILTAGGVIWMVRRSRKQQRELLNKLDEAEAELDATRPGVAALIDMMEQATTLLNYVAVHGGHAVGRWAAGLGDGQLSWDSLGQAQRDQYRNLLEVAQIQLGVVALDPQKFLTVRDDDLEELTAEIDKTMHLSRELVEARV